LRGQLPTELGLLSNLQHLELRLNELSGLIPTELGSLTSLGKLDLGKSATLSSSELDTIISLASVLQSISSTVL
jgi:Leucine-rich repeat (LRR) protein